MTSDDITRRRAESFNKLADDYDRHRPTYPPDLIVVVIDYAGRAVEHGVLEVGAGTGKATLAFAAEGLDITALEPGDEMARVLRHGAETLKLDDRITLRPGTFETLTEDDGPFGLIYSAQAFHWTDPDTRWDRLASLLSLGGAAALFSNHWEIDSGHHDVDTVRKALRSAADEDIEPDLGSAMSRNWADEIRRHGVLEGLEHAMFTSPWSVPTPEYLDLMATMSQYSTLPAERRTAALAALGEALGTHTQLNAWSDLTLARRG